MNKTSIKSIRVNFSPNLVSLVLNGKKFLTWRINDEENISVGDELILWLKGKNSQGIGVEDSKPFGKGIVIEVWERKFKDFGNGEKDGHEEFANDEDMVEQYKKYYGDWVSEETIVKIIRFKLIK